MKPPFDLLFFITAVSTRKIHLAHGTMGACLENPLLAQIPLVGILMIAQNLT
jgi:hypothetical protein